MARFGNRRQKSFEYASDATKQLIGLATGVIAFTVTFAKDFLSGVSAPLKILAVVSWAFYLLSTILGLLVLYSLAGQLDPGGKDSEKQDPDENKWHTATIWATPVRGLMKAQEAAFGLALLVTVLFSAIALWSNSPGSRTDTGTARTTNNYYVQGDRTKQSTPHRRADTTLTPPRRN
jgi:hypothetical protein